MYLENDRYNNVFKKTFSKFKHFPKKSWKRIPVKYRVAHVLSYRGVQCISSAKAW